ncbi:MAG: hypothetical protein IJV05_05795 [Muribaculaceae bacterium]|nr:hypothetical protein [Muribaculaceae bacterium]
MLLLQLANSNNIDTANENFILFLSFVVMFLVYIFFCILVGKYAYNRSRSFWGFFLLSVFFNPLIGFIIAAIVGGETQKQRANRIRLETAMRMQMEEKRKEQ